MLHFLPHSALRIARTRKFSSVTDDHATTPTQDRGIVCLFVFSSVSLTVLRRNGNFEPGKRYLAATALRLIRNGVLIPSFTVAFLFFPVVLCRAIWPPASCFEHCRRWPPPKKHVLGSTRKRRSTGRSGRRRNLLGFSSSTQKAARALVCERRPVISVPLKSRIPHKGGQGPRYEEEEDEEGSPRGPLLLKRRLGAYRLKSRGSRF